LTICLSFLRHRAFPCGQLAIRQEHISCSPVKLHPCPPERVSLRCTSYLTFVQTVVSRNGLNLNGNCFTPGNTPALGKTSEDRF
jgi:hypothetical protein